jgi:hypothetical protein
MFHACVIIHIIIYHLYWIMNTCLHVCLVPCSGACRIAKISSPSNGIYTRWLAEATLVFLAAETKKKLVAAAASSLSTLVLLLTLHTWCVTVSLIYCSVVIYTNLFGCVLWCFLFEQQRMNQPKIIWSCCRPIWLSMISLPKQAEYQRKLAWYILLQLNFIQIYSLKNKMFWLGKHKQEN